MKQTPQDELLFTSDSSQEEISRIERGKSSQNQNYEIIEASSDDDDADDADEVDTQDQGFSMSSFGQSSMSMLNKSRSFLANAGRPLRTPTIFAPRSPKNYRPLRKSRSADDMLGPSNHGGTEMASSPPSPPSSHGRSQSQSRDVFSTPKYLSKSDLMMKGSSHHTDDTFQFPSPFAARHSMNFGDFSPSIDINESESSVAATNDDPVQRISIRRISEGDAFQAISDINFSFHESMDLEDVFPSVFDDDPHRPSSSMPEMQSPLPLQSSSSNGKSGNGSRGSSFEHAMAIDPFEDSCVEFAPISPAREPMTTSASSQLVDLEAEMQALQKHHRQEVNDLRLEVETGKRIIGSLTKQVQDLMARNEKLSRQNDRMAKESSESYRHHNRQKKVARIDMMGHVTESPDSSPSIQQRHKTVTTSEKRHSKAKAAKRKSKKGKNHRISADDDNDIASTSTIETLMLDNHTTKKSKKRSSKAIGTTKKKKPKSKRSSNRLSTSSASLEADEHPLSQAKLRQSMKGKTQRHSIATSSHEKGVKGTRRSSSRLSETLEHIWAFDWKDPIKLEEKRDSSQKRNHQTKSLTHFKENLESVGKLPKRKGKRKTSKAKQGTGTNEPQDDSMNPTDANLIATTATSPKKAKKSNRSAFEVVTRLLSPKAEKRRKRTKTELLDSSQADSNMVQLPVTIPDL
ncbi:unnamed protein product [Cylindrotheca closterium]|uniref:Uncharacterized protein n=1 Tax=Cylindrotheca closterium TaxID=2856 RepID=A0AAD2JGS9_9STRA|nr:unnamed protein product [Cylindrotheca closterium]